MQLIKSHLKAGIWQGVLVGTSAATPDVRATYLGQTLEGLNCTKDTENDGWRVTLQLPPEVLSDGVQTVILADAGGTTLATIPIICGDILDDDLRAEIALLRSELDLLQRAFRKHCE